MKEFDYIIIGGGCAGLSLAYELEIHEKLKEKTLAIIEPRQEYKKDKTWSFWKVTTPGGFVNPNLVDPPHFTISHEQLRNSLFKGLIVICPLTTN